LKYLHQKSRFNIKFIFDSSKTVVLLKYY